MVVVQKTTLYPMLFTTKLKFNVESSFEYRHQSLWWIVVHHVGHKELIVQQRINRVGKPKKNSEKRKIQLTYGGSAKDHLVSHAIHIKTKIQC